MGNARSYCCGCCLPTPAKKASLLQPIDEEVEELDIRDMQPYRNSRLVSVRSEFSRFRQLKLLGKGGFGKVTLVEDEITGHYYAMKCISKQHIQQRNQRIHTKAERAILESISHPFIVKLQYAFQSPSRLFLVMDFMQGGELFFHLRKEHRFSQEKTQMYAAQLLLALEYLHDKNIVYRDLKPENILIGDDGYLRITDFGLSKIVSGDEKSYTYCGTPEYLAPEIFLEQGHGKAVDWWSLGALIYEMVAGAPPFYSKDQGKMFRNRINKPIDMKDHFSTNIRDLLKHMLQNNPTRRLGYQGAFEIKEHPFFNGIEFGKLYRKQYKMKFRPVLDSPKDLRYFDRMFTEQAVTRSPTEDKFSALRYSDYTYHNKQLELEL